jgi:hypothetical protein
VKVLKRRSILAVSTAQNDVWQSSLTLLAWPVGRSIFRRWNDTLRRNDLRGKLMESGSMKCP